MDQLICPVCGKTFPVTEDTKYMILGGYACDWKCFLGEVKRRDAEKVEKNDKKRTSLLRSGKRGI